MPSNIFHFKQFSIHQDVCAMKVGTDAVLLGAWVNPANKNRILDIGTGTGIIALMLAQKSNAVIDAIDVQEDACIQAKQNADASPWAKNLNFYHQPIQRFSLSTEQRYDLIVSNPPYFVDASKPSELGRITARHTDYNLSFEELLSCSAALLTEEGIFCLILPCQEAEHFMAITHKYGLYCTATMKVYTKVGKQPKRVLIQLEKKPAANPDHQSLVILDNDTRYTRQYIDFTADYYLGLNEFRNMPDSQSQNSVKVTP